MPSLLPAHLRTRHALRSSHRTVVVVKERCYDVSGFLDDHPGGAELISAWKGKDIGEVLVDAGSHAHSDAAYEVLEEYYVGDLVHGEDVRPDSACFTEGGSEVSSEGGFDSSSTTFPEAPKERERVEFLDMTRPLFPQMLASSFSKEFYLAQIHIPRHVQGSAPILGGILEPLTKAPWWIVPLVWGPVNAILLHQAWAHCPTIVFLAAYISGLLGEYMDPWLFGWTLRT